MRGYDQWCGLAQALDRVGDRWSLLVVRELLIGPRRYTDLRRNLPGIATNLLAERLRNLEREGIVRRRELAPPTPATLYELTDLGRGLEPAVLALVRWGGHFMQDARGKFRAEWLVLALRALLEGREGDADLACEIRAQGGDPFHLVSRDGRVGIAPGRPAEEADLLVAGEPRAVLALAAGAASLSELERAGRISVEGPEVARRRLERLLRAP